MRYRYSTTRKARKKIKIGNSLTIRFDVWYEKFIKCTVTHRSYYLN
ncbi:hypothetical protein MXB_3625 [Myxobolus squamalis]|nr:hypothetical protein MXB_3625 [Myxobolus squamalis]